MIVVSLFNFHSRSAPEGDDAYPQMGFTVIGLSILAHIAFLFALLFLQNLHFTKPLPPVIQVDLISFAPEPVFEDLSGPEPADEKAVDPDKDLSKEVVTPEAVSETGIEKTDPDTTDRETVPQKTPEIKKPDISLKTKPKNLQELIKSKQEKTKTEPVEKKPEKKAEKKDIPRNDKTDEQLAKALSRLEQLVREQNRLKQSARDPDKGDKDGSGGPSGSGKKNYKPIDLYNMVLASAINQNWVFNERLANMESSLETRVVITILKNGQLRDIFFETRSGNAYLDESAEKAIQRALPLPELPKSYSTYTVGLIFTPKGLK